MKATDFEFRNRFWIFGLIFGVGFWLYAFDDVNIVQYLVNVTIGEHSPHADLMIRCALAFAALLMLLTALLRTWATSYLRSDVMQDHDLRAEKVVASGPYRHLRNPLYLGNILMAFGMGLLASRVGFLVIAAGNLIFCLRLIGLEESNLRKEQGESYIEFCRRVPRLWPSLQPRLPDSGLKPHWKQAFVGELFMWGFFAAGAVFAITLNIKSFWIILAASIVAYIATSYLIAWRKKTETHRSRKFPLDSGHPVFA